MQDTNTTSTELTPGVRLIRRNRQIVTWSAGKIEKAVRCAFAELGLDSSPAIHIAAAVTTRVKEEGNACVGIEDVQDMVQEELMRQGHYPVAAHYILYRAERARHRTEMVDGETSPLPSEITIGSPGGNEPYNPVELRRRIAFARTGLDLCLPPKEIERELLRSVGTVMTRKDLDATIILNAKTLIEKDADFGKFAGRILLTFIYEEVLDWSILRDGFGKLKKAHRAGFAAYLARGVEVGRIDPALVGRYDVDAMAKALDPSADLDFDYLGVQTLYDRYLLVDKTDGEHVRLETPQFFWMRVAMGLFKEEDERVKTLNPLGFKHGTLPETRHAETYAVQLYNLYKSRRFCSSTPTLFNSGTPHSQLSSCYISVVDDNIESIFQRGIADSAYMAKFAGGLGGSWTNVRGTGSHIKGTNGESQGVIPFFKVYNDMLNAVNQCFVPGTLIHTSRGILPIEEVNALDAVLTEAGTYSMVEDAMVYKQEDPMVSLRLKHSSGPLLVTAGHPVYAIKNVTYAQNVARTLGQLKRGALTADWVAAGELRRNDCVGIAIPSGAVDVDGFTEAKCLLYGAMLGNGHICKDRNEAGISCHKDTGLEMLRTVRGSLKDLQVPFWENELHGSCVQIKWTHIPDVFGFDRDDLYNAEDFKRIHPRLTHLPLNKAAWLIEGMLKTDGNVSRGKEVTFSTASSELGEGLRYQVLRLGAPTHAYTRVRDMDHTGTRRDGSTFRMEGVSYEMKVSVPMIKPLADLMGVPALTKFNWFAWQGKLFTRVKSTESSAYRGQVHDLKVDGPASYCTVDALVHNGGKRRGSGCNYLETWHNDLEDFMELRKNVGDDRRRCHEMNTAHWIPDLFMKRMEARQDWSYFRSNEVPDLHDLYGKAFEQRYAEYEVLAAAGKIWSKVVPAVEVWKLMLKSVFETGHPWLTFKDPCNVRSPQDHYGVIHSSNLCTEITLVTNSEEIAVCNLGSVVIEEHLTDTGEIDHTKLKETVTLAVRALDNVIDINFYPVPATATSNSRHRPIGLGMMGLQNALHKKGLAFASQEAVEFNDEIAEAIAYYAYLASSQLAKEKGTYSTYEGSKWSRGILPQDTIDLLQEEREIPIDTPRGSRMDWAPVREHIAVHGMRNSNVMAIAPTATISNIMATTPCIEPNYKNLFVKSNMSGDFTVLSVTLVRELKALGLWGQEMLDQLKYYDGELADIPNIPEDVKRRHATVFGVPYEFVIDAAARRQKWIDQSQSVNLFLPEPDMKVLSRMYRYAWSCGLKTTYYLRTLGASGIEKSTIDAGKALRGLVAESAPESACSLEARMRGEVCESCQ